MLSRFFLITITLFALAAEANDLLEHFCALEGGDVVNELTCPKSKIPLPWKFCVFKNGQGDRLFFNGCTGPSGGHSALFYPACIQHDHCYHHEPVSNGLSRRDCDERFLVQLSERCELAADQENCLFWARTMFRAVRTGGFAAFNCAKYEADYE